MNNFSLKSGFTLIEILVVMSIISVLSVVLYLNFNQAQLGANDDIRKNDLRELQLALKLYKAQYGQYPDQGCQDVEITSWSGPGTHSGIGANLEDCPEYIVGLVPEFMSELPTDPSLEYDHKRGYLYHVTDDNSAYKVLVYKSVETKFVTSYDDEFARCPKDYDKGWCDTLPQKDAYAIYSVGAEAL